MHDIPSFKRRGCNSCWGAQAYLLQPVLLLNSELKPASLATAASRTVAAKEEARASRRRLPITPKQRPAGNSKGCGYRRLFLRDFQLLLLPLLGLPVLWLLLL